MQLKFSSFFSIPIITVVLMALANTGYGQRSFEIQSYINQQYQNLIPLEGSRPELDIYQKGMIGYYNLLASGISIPNNKITLIDFRLSSNKKRMWVIDITTNKVIHHRLVAHGKNTGEEYARNFSNIRNSNQSSLGFYLTGENYYGKHGLSLRLDGQEVGFNDKARERAIVMHSATYVSKDFTKKVGRLGRSFGCPAIALKDHREIIKGLANKSLLFIFYPQEQYLQGSRLLNMELANNYFVQANI